MRILKKELWPYKTNYGVDDSNLKIDKIEYWLGENIGAFKSQWNAVYHSNSTDFYFREPDDLMMFKLTWS
jgi:hypothetical protein